MLKITHYIIALFILSLTACSVLPKGEAKYPNQNREQQADQGSAYKDNETIFGEGGFGSVLMGKTDGDTADADNVLNINAFLWRASLETINFMPISQADPFGGVILTDWYSAAQTPNQRYKLNILITDKQLRASGVKVSMFKEQRASENAKWESVTVAKEDTRKIEDAILARAREMRIASLEK
ncbi:MAG: hypothetical protein CMH30_01650 [Micavibrio sp.]|nr:hypothetical protein [Micavibrio sp.]|tara:strand:- start:1663 stop:2211 length:549 start_codon:yes stop_codon:yes gene_type:complete